ncbi:hypothetical protein [Oerskovia jenensis]|uniref:hypothetical protein n=1 Tax=Oerskovia jenensis TaxID=162169 RepID=UPI0036DB368E
MPDDLLFDLGHSEKPAQQQVPPAPIRDDQIAEIRAAFEAAGITDQDERRVLVESCVQRPAASLRELRATDARFVLERLAARAKLRGDMTAGSAWDQRDSDTWIDRL